MAGKRRARESGESTSPRTGGKKVAASDCRTLMQETLENEFEEILGAFVVAAKKGSSAHMKLATELLERAAKPGKRNAGSALRLLRELEGEDVTG